MPIELLLGATREFTLSMYLTTTWHIRNRAHFGFGNQWLCALNANHSASPLLIDKASLNLQLRNANSEPCTPIANVAIFGFDFLLDVPRQDQDNIRMSFT